MRISPGHGSTSRIMPIPGRRKRCWTRANRPPSAVLRRGSAAQAQLLHTLACMMRSTSVITIGSGSLVEIVQLVDALHGTGQLTAVDSSTQGIALIRKMFFALSDTTQTTLRAVNAPVNVFSAASQRHGLRPDRRLRRCGELFGHVCPGAAAAPGARRHRVHRHARVRGATRRTAVYPIPPTAATRRWPCGNCWTWFRTTTVSNPL